MFIANMRITTWAMIALFVAAAAARRDRRFLAAGLAWFTGFETLYQLTSYATGHPTEGWWGTPFLVIPGLVVVPLAWRAGIKPNQILLAAAVVVWIAWIADGFNANLHAPGGFNANRHVSGNFHLSWEILNVAAKTTIGLAFLLWGRRSPGLEPARILLRRSRPVSRKRDARAAA